MKLDPPTHMKHERNGNSCPWAGMASWLALLGGCRLTWLGWLGWPAHGREGVGRGSCVTLWWRWRELQSFRRSQGGLNSIDQSSKTSPQGEEAMNLLLPATKKGALQPFSIWNGRNPPIQTHQNHVHWKEGTSQKGREQELYGCSLKAVAALVKSHKC